MKKVGIYKITNKINGKCYIGQSRDIERRLRGHLKKSNCPILYSKIKHYGVESFTTEILIECAISELNDFEIYFIDLFNCVTPFGYNILKGGNGTLEWSELSKHKMSMMMKGRVITDSHKLNLSISNTGKKRTDEQKQHQSDVMKGKPSINKGKKMSDEQKRKISETQKLNRRNR